MAVIMIYDWNIQSLWKLPSVITNATVIYEDNSACIFQIKEVYIKGDWTKHISPKFFYAHDLQKEGVIIKLKNLIKRE